METLLNRHPPCSRLLPFSRLPLGENERLDLRCSLSLGEKKKCILQRVVKVEQALLMIVSLSGGNSNRSSCYAWVRPLGGCCWPSQLREQKYAAEGEPGARVLWITGLAHTHPISPIFLVFDQLKECTQNSLLE